MALDVTLPARRALEVRPVASKRELNTFIKLPWRLYRNEPNWVPPLVFDRKRFLDRSRNPFFKPTALFLRFSSAPVRLVNCRVYRENSTVASVSICVRLPKLASRAPHESPV